jgi:hypothetical protein
MQADEIAGSGFKTKTAGKLMISDYQILPHKQNHRC